MRSFDERDVRRHYDLLQHKPELGLTELKAMDGSHIVGLGLFDNEENFVSECRRYNGLGGLYVGLNPRSNRLLEDLGGLKNRMRTLFMDVAGEADIAYVTGVAVSGRDRLAEATRRFRRDVSVLFDREVFFPMDEPIPIPPDGQAGIAQQIARWMYGEGEPETVSLMQFVRVMGTELSEGGWFHRRARFWKYRPYLLDGIASEITGKGADEEEIGEG